MRRPPCWHSLNFVLKKHNLIELGSSFVFRPADLASAGAQFQSVRGRSHAIHDRFYLNRKRHLKKKKKQENVRKAAASFRVVGQRKANSNSFKKPKFKLSVNGSSVVFLC